MIEVKNLTKRYGNHEALHGISFTVESGSIYGFLGPNGAGKSTTMNIITGCLAATSGSVTVGGVDVFDNPVEAKKKLGYLPEQPPVYGDMTPYEYLSFVGEAKGLRGRELIEQIERVIIVTQIDGVRERLIKNLSKGFRQRVGIAQAMLGNPEIIILDEPTVGLDPKQIIEIRELIRSLGKEHTVILSSHILSEISAVCDHIIIISEGSIVADDDISEIEKNFSGTSSIKLTVKCPLDRAGEIAAGIDGVTLVFSSQTKEDECILTLEHKRDADMREAVSTAFTRAGVTVLELVPVVVTLEDIFIDLTTPKIPDAAEPFASLNKEDEEKKDNGDDDKGDDENGDDNNDGDKGDNNNGDDNNKDGGDGYKPLFG